MAADCKRQAGKKRRGVWQKCVRRECCVNVFKAFSDIGILDVRLCHIAYNFSRSSVRFEERYIDYVNA